MEDEIKEQIEQGVEVIRHSMTSLVTMVNNDPNILRGLAVAMNKMVANLVLEGFTREEAIHLASGMFASFKNKS